MWDRLLVDCNIATLEETPGNPLGLIENGAIAIDDGKILRVGKRTELAGFRAQGGRRAWRRLGYARADRLPHPPRLRRHARRRACNAPRRRELRADRASGRRIASTVAADCGRVGRGAARAEPPAAPRADGGGCTTVEIKSGYGLDPPSELRLLKIASELGEGEAVRIVPTLLALHALPADQRDRRAHYVSEIVDKLIPARGRAGLATSVDAFCDTIAFTPGRGRAAVQGGGAPRASGPASCRAIVQSARRRARRAVPTRSRPTISNISTRRAPRRWRRRARSRCFSPAPLRAAGEEEAAGRICCASTGCRSRSRPIATRAPRRCSRRRWR